MQRRLVLACATVAIAVLGTTASPAAAHGTSKAKAVAYDCNNFAAASSLTANAAVVGRGDDMIKEPTLNVVTEALPESAEGRGAKNWKTVTVPVWFHVVSDGEIGNVTQQQIDDQIRIMNLGYSGFYGGADQGFRYRLAGVTRTDNAEWFNAGPGSPAEREMKRALRRGDMGTLNYYSTTAGPYLGWAYLPGLQEPLQYLDGIVVDWESMFKTSTRYEGRFDLGFTAVHEAGHWFGLEHTFYGGCNANGDFVDDTPPMKVPTSGCPEGKDTCTREPGLDPIHNFMDYSDDPCYSELTEGQALRSKDHWLEFRA
ncbi:MAG: zinc metalloprotease [Actinomycetota bacterium]|nr:zinc metalloprotease [Actinomycetota bacterium]